MFARALLRLTKFWNWALEILEINVRYTSVPLWSPWRDFTFHRDEGLPSSR
jgi:hypothetical protein